MTNPQAQEQIRADGLAERVGDKIVLLRFHRNLVREANKHFAEFEATQSIAAGDLGLALKGVANALNDAIEETFGEPQ